MKRSLFWPVVLGVALLCPKARADDTTPATVAVPVDEMRRLQVEFAYMRERIAKLEGQLEKAAGAALACYASNSWSGGKWR